MSIFTFKRCQLALIVLLTAWQAKAQTPAFPGAMGFGRYAPGARGATSREVYIVKNLNDSGSGSFRDAVSKPGRIVVFAVGGIIRLSTDVVVAANTTIAGQTAPGDGIVLFNKGISFSGANNAICRFLRVRLGATGNSGNDAAGLSNGTNMIFDHLSITWGMDENFSINWDNKGNSPDNITVQNSIIGQGLFRENHSAGGLIQTPDGGRVSLLQNLYISNKTRNPKVKGVNEFVNNVVYDWGNGNRLDQNFNYGWAADAYIMGGSSGVSEVNVINNYFCGGPLTPPTKTTPFSRGTGTFNIHGSGNYFDNNRNGILDGTVVPFDSVGYPGITGNAFKLQPYPYPAAYPAMTAEQAYQHVIDSVGAWYPHRDQVDGLMIDEVASKGTKGLYVYRETDLPLVNGGVGNVFGAPAALDTDGDGMPDAWEEANQLNKNDKTDAVAFSVADPRYLNIEIYINALVYTPPPAFIKPPTNLILVATSQEVPPGSTVKLTWVDNADNETGFVLERSSNGVNFNEVGRVDTNVVTFTDNAGLSPNTVYYYRLKAVNETEISAYSATVTVTTPPIPTAPAVTANPSPVNGSQYVALTSGKVSLKWTGSSSTQTYAVYLGTDTGSLAKQTDVAYSVSPTFTTTVLNDNTVYYWRIDAVNAKGLAKGQVWSFRTSPIIPQGLVGNWAFDEPLDAVSTQIVDSTSYANTGVLGLDADNRDVRVKGKIKNALDFASADPSIYVVRLPNQDQLHLDKSPFSISFWMKAPASMLPQDNNTSAYLLCKGSITRNSTTGASGKRFDIEFKNKQIRFAIDDDNDAAGGGKDELQVNGVPFFTNNWVHVVVIRDVTNKKLLMYMNGAQVGSIAISKANSGIGEASALVLGNIGELEFLAPTNKPAPYKGMLDEVRVYNYVLSQTEITALAAVKNTQTIAFEPIPEQRVDAADFIPVALASSGLMVSLSSADSTVAIIQNGKIHLVGAGTTSIIATQEGDNNYYAAAAVSQSLVVVKNDQLITFNPLPVKTYGADNFKAGATSSSGLTVTYKSTDTSIVVIDSLSGDMTIRKAGTATIIAAQSGNNKFNAAVSISQVLKVLGKPQTIIFNPLPLKTLGDDDFIISATASSGLPVVFESSNTSVATIMGNTISIIGAGTAFIKAVQTGNEQYRDTAVTQNLIIRNFNLSIQTRDGDNGQGSNNTIRPFLQLVNNDSAAVSYNQLSVRYWFTAENLAGINTWIDYAQMGGNNINMKYVSLNLPRNGALGYMEYAFTGNALLAAHSSSGPIQSRFANKDWANLQESDDYSYQGNPGIYTQNPHITLYRNGKLIYGQEPEIIPVITKVNVVSQHQNSANSSIGTYLAINNLGNTPLNYSELKVRYWFTKEGTAGLNHYIDYARMGANLINGKFTTIPQALENADTYFELWFGTAAGILNPLSNSGNIQYRMAKADWSAFIATNDHSYLPRISSLQENNHITVYYQNQLIYGIEPAEKTLSNFTANKTSNTGINNQLKNDDTLSGETPEKITLYPNPLTNSGQFSVALTSDLLNKEINLKILNAFGVVIQRQLFKHHSGSVNISLNGNYLPGVYFVKVNEKPMVRLMVN